MTIDRILVKKLRGPKSGEKLLSCVIIKRAPEIYCLAARTYTMALEDSTSSLSGLEGFCDGRVNEMVSNEKKLAKRKLFLLLFKKITVLASRLS
uniref:AlNc14C151G7545 protein n=1 Tax=Albugo laibachii Nc14 TaxID=890382 RepID=F0WM34_9STRA|nr:AlNc14C151G7545 [Albugo laibachii Nc14]|eukprot:CCA22361.1 AlNc14C151G7545 [Albugo laibachii Nc14]